MHFHFSESFVYNFLFFAEFTREVTDTQMPLVAPVILPEMYKIFTMAEVLLYLLMCSLSLSVLSLWMQAHILQLSV